MLAVAWRYHRGEHWTMWHGTLASEAMMNGGDGRTLCGRRIPDHRLDRLQGSTTAMLSTIPVKLGCKRCEQKAGL